MGAVDYDTDHNHDESLSYITPPKTVSINYKNQKSNMQIQGFDLNHTVDNSHYAIIGKKGSGKSVVVRSIIENLWKSQKISECIVISPTDKFNGFYEKFVPIKNIHYEINFDNIKNILQDQIKNKKRKICVVLDESLISKGKVIKE